MGNQRSCAQAQDMAQLTAELIPGCGIAPVGLKVEKLETYDAAKHFDVDNWLFQMEEHLALTRVLTDSQVAHATLLLRSNAAMW